MLQYLNLPLDGRHHSGIDDCNNISKIFIKMWEDGYRIDEYNICFVNNNK